MSPDSSAPLEIHTQPAFLKYSYPILKLSIGSSSRFIPSACSVTRKKTQLKLNLFQTSFGRIYFFNVLKGKTGARCFVPALFKYSFPAWPPTHILHPSSSLASLGNTKCSGTCQNLSPNVYSLCCCRPSTNDLLLSSSWSSIITSEKLYVNYWSSAFPGTGTIGLTRSEICSLITDNNFWWYSENITFSRLPVS